MELVQQSFGITFVFVLLGLLLWWLKRGGAVAMRTRFYPVSKRDMELVERLPLTAQHSLQLVRVMDRTLLIGISPAGLNLIHDLPSQPSPIQKELDR